VGGAGAVWWGGRVASDEHPGSEESFRRMLSDPGDSGRQQETAGDSAGDSATETARVALAFQRGPIKRPERALQKLVRVYAPPSIHICEYICIYIFIYLYISFFIYIYRKFYKKIYIFL